MRRVVAVLVVALLLLTLVGCASDAGTEAPEEAAVTPAAPVANAGDQKLADRSPVEPQEPQPFPVLEEPAPPEAVQQKLDAGRAMLMFFYDSAQESTAPQRAEVDAVMRDYRGLIDLVTFDVTEETAAQLAGTLGVRSTPYVIVVDRDGDIIWRWLGFVDRDIIGREVLSATE